MKRALLILLLAIMPASLPGAAATRPASGKGSAETKPAAALESSAQIVRHLAADARKRAALARASGDARGLCRALGILRKIGEATRQESLEVVTSSLIVGDAETARNTISEMKGHELSPVVATALEGACAEAAGNSSERDRLWDDAARRAEGSKRVLQEAMTQLDAVCGSGAGASRFAQAVLKCPPEGSRQDIAVLFQIVICARNAERFEEASNALRQLSTILQRSGLDEKSMPMAQSLDLYEKAGRALRAFDGAALLEIAGKSDDDEIAVAVGRWMRLAGKGAEADRIVRGLAEKLEARIKANPNDGASRNALAWAYARTKTNLEEARKLAERAVELSPDEGAYLDTLAEVEYALGHKEAAAQTETRAILCPEKTSRSFYFEQLKRFKAGAQ